MNPSNHLCLFEDRESEAETIPDEEYAFINNKREMKSNTWHVGVSNNPNLGPNINLKYFKKTYDTEEEKQFITKKFEQKKKLNYAKIGNYIMHVFTNMNVLSPMVLMN